jgi:hypothetical protein
MNVFRATIALLLVMSIVAVVALITITMIYASSTPEEQDCPEWSLPASRQGSLLG